MPADRGSISRSRGTRKPLKPTLSCGLARGGGERVERIVGRGEFAAVEAHRAEKGGADLVRLAGLEDIAFEASAAERVTQHLGSGQAVAQRGAIGDRQRNALVERRVAD